MRFFHYRRLEEEKREAREQGAREPAPVRQRAGPVVTSSARPEFTPLTLYYNQLQLYTILIYFAKFHDKEKDIQATLIAMIKNTVLFARVLIYTI